MASNTPLTGALLDRSFLRGIAIFAAIVASATCTPVIMKTPVRGSTGDVSRLIGEWQGDYSSMESGRRGVITFRLRAGADTAEGDVLMESGSGNEPSVPDASVPREAFSAQRQVLSIRFVFVDADEVSGVLDPYKDPGCGCDLKTTFRGTLRENIIEGTFHSEGSGFGHIPQDGRWRVKRVTSDNRRSP